MTKSIEEILAPRPEAHPHIYAYSIDDKARAGLLKIDQTIRDVKRRIADQHKTARDQELQNRLDELSERHDGTIFSDHEVRAVLVRKGFEIAELEWVRSDGKGFWLRTNASWSRPLREAKSTRSSRQRRVRHGWTGPSYAKVGGSGLACCGECRRRAWDRGEWRSIFWVA